MMTVVPRPNNLNLAILALIAACGGRVLPDQGSHGGGARQTGAGSGTFGSGTGSTGSGTSSGTGSSGTGISVTGAGGGSAGSPEMGGAPTGAAGNVPLDCVAPPPKPSALLASNNLSDLESGILITTVVPVGGGWFSYRDPEANTVFSPDPDAFMTDSPGLNGTAHAVHVLGKGFIGPASATNWGGGVGMALSLGGPALPAPTDLSAFRGISFWAKSGSVVSDISVQISTVDTDPNYCTCAATSSCYATHSFLLSAVPQVEAKYTVRFTDLRQPDYIGAPTPFDPSHVLNIIFSSNGPVQDFDYWVDEISVVK